MTTGNRSEHARHHCVISGTGRTGTSFLIQLLTHLGLDTGYTVDNLNLYQHARAGLELDVRSNDAPFIVKSPWFCDYADEVFDRDDIVIDHLFIPMRDLYAAAESRRHVVRESVATLEPEARASVQGSKVAGGLWHTDDGAEQESVLQSQVYKLLLAASATDVPVTLLRYPRLVVDPQYLFEKLSPLLGTIAFDAFGEVLNEVARPDWMHRFGEQDAP